MTKSKKNLTAAEQEKKSGHGSLLSVVKKTEADRLSNVGIFSDVTVDEGKNAMILTLREDIKAVLSGRSLVLLDIRVEDNSGPVEELTNKLDEIKEKASILNKDMENDPNQGQATTQDEILRNK